MNPFQQRLDEWGATVGAQVIVASVRVNTGVKWRGVSMSGESDMGDISPHSRFPIYSITKTLTAVCILRLDEGGLLSVEDPIAKWIAYPLVPETLTLSQLLRHTSGIPDYGPLPQYHEAVRTCPGSPWTDDEFLRATLSHGLLFDPGNGWCYSNVGYLLLRRVIERARGRTFRQCIEEQIAKPLGLTDTFVAETIRDWESCVPGFGRELQIGGEEADVRSSYHPGWCAPGVAVSTVDDVTMLYDSLFGGALLKERQLAQMLQLVPIPGADSPALSSKYGMGIMADSAAPFGPGYGHGGGGPGYSLFAWIVPASPLGRLSVAVFCNRSDGIDVEPAVRALFEVAVAGTPAT